MKGIKLGCQSITWGESQSADFPKVFAEAAAAGFAGLEIGFRHIQKTAPDELKRLLGARGLTLLGTHVGGNLVDASQAAGERNMLDQTLEYLQRMDASLLMYSGLRYQSDSQFQRDLEMLRWAAKRCEDRGIRLLYHNHNWEFADDGRIINALIEKTNVGFCPDIGWVARGGQDVLALLNRIKSRVGAVHFKDFPPGPADSKVVDPVLLGQGVAPLAQAARWAKEHVPDVWMIAEQDSADQPAAQAVRRNGAYLRRIFDI